MKHPVLLDVPKDSPTRKEKLDAFKEANGIWTHHAGHCAPDRWCALAVTKSIEFLNGYLASGESTEPIELIAGYCRLLDDADLLVDGRSEIEVVRKVCDYNDIPCDL